MLRFAKRIGALVVLGLIVQFTTAFVLLGPNNEAYQDPVIGYNPNLFIDFLPTGPKNIDEEYRRNTPVIYYTFDESFLGFFGSNGVAAVDEAFAILNGLQPVSTYSPELYEFPYEAQSYNYQAEALALTDVKSTALHFLVEQLGLGEPDRYTWTLHSREHLGGAPPCPVGMIYFVIKRNLDPITSPLNEFQYSSYVNSVLYSYQVEEYCTTPNSPAPPLLADAVEFPVDPLAHTFTAVASGGQGTGASQRSSTGQLLGLFYTGLTRDDVGGLRYLIRTNNMNVEAAGDDTVTFITNTATRLLVTSNLALLVAQAYTNDAAALSALYPDIVIASTTNFFTLEVTTNFFAFFYNPPGGPAGLFAQLRFTNVMTTNVVERFSHTFANVVTNTYYTNVYQTVSNFAYGPFCSGGAAGSFCTNIQVTTTRISGVSGDYYVIPPTNCGISIISQIFSNVVVGTSNSVSAVIPIGVTNVGNQIFAQSVFTYYTNHQFIVRAINCPTNTVARRQGIEKITFVRRDLDSALGDFFYPITNTYTLTAVTNSALFPQTIRRIVRVPDIVFTAEDLTGGSGSATIFAVSRNIPFVTSNAIPNLAGPGTIRPGSVITFNKVGPVYWNPLTDFLDESVHAPILIWGTFDGSTNAPIVYPNGTSIQNLENQVLIEISPAGASLPTGTVGQNYSDVFGNFSATGGTPPYTWSLSPNSPALPPGLTINSNGTISGMPDSSTAGLTYDVIIRLTDLGARFVDRPYSITINP